MSAHDDALAVIGLACRVPGARDAGAFWAALEAGREGRSTFSDEELRAAGLPAELLARPEYVKAGFVIEDADLFDAPFFGFTPREAELTDPQQRLFLETAWTALERAGYTPDRMAGSVGVFAGCSLNTYLALLLDAREGQVVTPDMLLALGNDKDHLATRVAYKLDLHGPAVTVQTACSTSLVAVHQACQSLLHYECDVALAGGVSVRFPQRRGYLFQEGGLGSPDGHCRPFDARGRGTVRGNGVGAVVLKRLGEALADGDHVHAVVRGSAVNNDGGRKVGYTAPSAAGQSEVIEAALAAADVPPETIGFIEAHGTATALGDPIEFAALRAVFGDARDEPCFIGAVKSNIGHLDAAAGVVGFIKAVLAVEHGRIPPTLHFETPNPGLQIERTCFRVNAAAVDWRAPAGAPRRAGVSSFGIGGTNAHVVVEQAPARAAGAPPPAGPHVIVLSARTASAADTACADLARHLASRAEPLADVAYTLQVGRRASAHRRALVCGHSAAAVAILTAGDVRLLRGEAEEGERGLAFLFPGQDAPRAGLGAGLYAAARVFREQVDRGAERLCSLLGTDVRHSILTSDGDAALFVVEHALAQLLLTLGAQPEALLGQGVGEYVAACLAGVFSFEDGVALAAERGRSMQAPSAGAPATPSAAGRFEQVLRGVRLSPPRLRVLSAVSGDWLRAEDALDPAYWVRQLHAPARLADALACLRGAQSCALAEVGPGSTLTGLVHAQYGAQRACVPVLPAGAPGDEWLQVHAALARLWVDGAAVRWDAAARAGTRRVPLPTYPFEGRRYFVEAEPRATPPQPALEPSDPAHWTYGLSWQRALPVATAGLPAARWLVLVDDDAGLGTGLVAWLRAAGHTVTCVRRGATFVQVDAESFRVAPGVRSDFEALASALVRDGAWPERVLHLWTLGPPRSPGEEEIRAFGSLWLLVQALGEHGAGRGLDIAVVSAGVHDVSGEETLTPERALLLGPTLVIPREFPGWRCLAMDVEEGAGLAPAAFATHLAAALQAVPRDPIVALRGRHLWTPAFVGLPLPAARVQPLREAGVYLVTGGLGGVGLALAVHLAEHVRARVALVGRSGPPAGERGEAVRRALQRIEACGAPALVLHADVADETQVRAALAAVRAHFGTLHGVFHAAGVTPGGSMARKTLADAEAVLRPKVAGTRALDAALGGAPLDFLVLFSSLAAWLGLPGRADYSAANAFLGAFARQRSRRGQHTLAIDWDTWAEVGMAARAGTADGLTTAQGLDVLERSLSAPGAHVAVSRLDLPALAVAARGDGRTAERAPQGARHPRPPLKTAFVTPRDERERALAAVWEAALGLAPVGIDDDFFELGGDSVLALQVVAGAARAGIRFSPRQLFECPTVAALAAAGDAPAVQAEQGAVVGELPPTPIQRWFFEQDLPRPEHWNQSLLFELREPLDAERLQAALRAVVRHHDALRLRAERAGSGWRLWNAEPGGEDVSFERMDLSVLPESARRAAFEQGCARLQASGDLARGPLVRAGLFDFGPQSTGRLLLVLHHLIVDAVSWRILLEDLLTLYEAGAEAELPAKTTSFRTWAQRLARYARSDEARAEAAYWLADSGPTLALPRDRAGAREDDRESSAESVAAALDEETTQALVTLLPRALGVHVEGALVAALERVLTGWAGGALRVDVEKHGREMLFDDVDLTRTVGWFTAFHPLRLEFVPGEALLDGLRRVARRLRSIPRDGVGYGLLRYLGDADPAEALARQPRPEVSFLYLGQLAHALPAAAPFAVSADSPGPQRHPSGRRSHALAVDARIAAGRLHTTWTFSRAAHARGTIERCVGGFLDVLAELVRAADERSGPGMPEERAAYLAELDSEVLRRVGALLGEADARPPGERR